MDLKKCQPVLFVKDARVSSKFYTDVLGFTVIMENGGVNITFKEGFTVWQIWEGNIVGFSNAKIDISKNLIFPKRMLMVVPMILWVFMPTVLLLPCLKNGFQITAAKPLP